MTQLTRRLLLQAGLAASTASLIKMEAHSQASSPAADFGFAAVGKLAPRTSLSIKASSLGIGFETLDRKVFEPEKTYAPLASLGVKWARCQTGWARTERTMMNYKGVLHGKDYSPKPSYFARQNVCALFDAETKAADFLLRSAGVQDEPVFAASFVRRGAPLFVRWMPTSWQLDKPMRCKQMSIGFAVF